MVLCRWLSVGLRWRSAVYCCWCCVCVCMRVCLYCGSARLCCCGLNVCSAWCMLLCRLCRVCWWVLGDWLLLMSRMSRSMRAARMVTIRGVLVWRDMWRIWWYD